MLSTPTSAASILAGETLGRFFVAALQSVFIIVAAALLFGVRWGDPIGAIAVVLMFSLVSTGAAMVCGALLRTEQQAGALVPFALALAALGGSMVPLDVFPDTMKTVSKITPHAWANEAFSELRIHGADVLDLLPQLGVLAGFAVVLLGGGATLLRRRLTL
jgi:ABC-2 type transport system permease protein